MWIAKLAKGKGQKGRMPAEYTVLIMNSSSGSAVAGFALVKVLFNNSQDTCIFQQSVLEV